MLELRFHADVEQEIDDAYTWYESQVSGLGEDFLHELDNSLVSIQTMPKAWTSIALGCVVICYKNFLMALFINLINNQLP